MEQIVNSNAFIITAILLFICALGVLIFWSGSLRDRAEKARNEKERAQAKVVIDDLGQRIPAALAKAAASNSPNKDLATRQIEAALATRNSAVAANVFSPYLALREANNGLEQLGYAEELLKSGSAL